MESFNSVDINPAYLGNRMKRAAAFLIDIFPITMVIMYVFIKFYGFQEIVDGYLLDQNDPVFKEPFEAIQRKIGYISLGIYIVYAFVMECSIAQATFGKMLLGIKVIGLHGNPPTPKEALWRNISKIISNAILSMGFIWILFDPKKRGWHDIIAKTLVVEKEFNSENSVRDEFDNPKINATPLKKSQPYSFNSNFHQLKEGNQTNLLFPAEIDSVNFKSIADTHADYEERIKQFNHILIEEVKQKNSNISADLFWNNSTRGQKLLQAFTIWNYYLKTSDSFDFLFHKSEYLWVLSDVFSDLEDDNFLNVHNAIITSFFESEDSFRSYQKAYESDHTNQKTKLESYELCKAQINGCEEMDLLYANDAARTRLYERACTFILNNPSYFIK